MNNKFLAILLVIILTMTVFVSADTNVLTSAAENEAIAPFYVPHFCHVGTAHEFCESDSEDEACGCSLTIVKCCCGKIMASHMSYCKEHGY